MKVSKLIYTAVALALVASSCDFSGKSGGADADSTDVENGFDESLIQFSDRDIFDLLGDAERMITSGTSWYGAGLYEFSPNGKWTNPRGTVERDSLYRIISYADTTSTVRFSYGDDGVLLSYETKGKTHTIHRNARDMEKGYDYIAIDDEGNWIGRIDLNRKESDRNRDEIRFISYAHENDPYDPDVRREILDQFKDFRTHKTDNVYYQAAPGNVYSSVYPYRTNSKIRMDLLDVYATGEQTAKGIVLVVDNSNNITYFATVNLKKNNSDRWQITFIDFLNMINFEKTPVEEKKPE